MPLQKSASKDAFKSNLEAELGSGKPKKQSLAIAYSVQRKSGGDPLFQALGSKKKGAKK